VPEKKPKIIAIVGATASGKTALSLALAKQFSGEIISADSRQIYRGLDIGTAKITSEEMGGVPHHLIDVVNVDQSFSAHDFSTLATSAITDITSRGNLPIIVGGTFFYLDQLRGQSGKAPVPPNPKLRAELEALTLPELKSRLEAFNPTLFSNIDIQNPRRIMRALEILETLGYIPEAEKIISPYDWLIIGLQTDKETLRERYRQRAEDWLKIGFLDEIKDLIAQKVSEKRLAEIGFEYTLGLALLNKEITKTEFIDCFEQKNWQYAKRQLTWLKRDQTINWFKSDQPSEILDTVTLFLRD
jgi:tRNA dimethylallyltransferase